MGFFSAILEIFFGKKPAQVEARSRRKALESLVAKTVDLRPARAAVEPEQQQEKPKTDPLLDARPAADDSMRRLNGRLLIEARSVRGGERLFIQFIRRSILGKGLRLPAVPEAVLKMERLIRQPNCNLRDLVAVVELESAISTKLVGVASSAAYGAGQPPATLREAMLRLGMRETTHLIQAITFGARLLRVKGKEREIHELHERSVLAAIASRAIAEHVRADSDQAFFAALIQDIGHSVLLGLFGEFQHQAQGRVELQPSFVERLFEGVHAEVSALVAESWNLSPELTDAVRHHESPINASSRLTWIVAASDDLVQRILDQRDRNVTRPPNPRILNALGLQQEALDAVIAETLAAAEAYGFKTAPRPVARAV